MNLKEAFRCQNKLQSLMYDAEEILRNRANITKVTSTNLRHKVMPEMTDETVVEIPESEYSGRITDVALFLVFLLEEKTALAAAIRKSKDQLDIDMDSETGLNSARQRIAGIFRTMNSLRASEQTIANGGTGYRFNQEGNQVMYRCDVKRVATIHFNRVTVRNLASEMDRKADATSEELDRCLVNAKVNYDAPFDVNDAFAEVFETFAGGENA